MKTIINKIRKIAVVVSCLALFVLAGSASAATISWHVNNGNGPLAATDFAGINLVSNWTVVTAAGTSSNLKDNSNLVTTAKIVYSGGFGPYRMSSTTPGQDSDTTMNKRMINSYANANTASQATFAITGIPYQQYSIYVYFSSDTAGRSGTNSDGTTVYTYTSIGPASISGGTATFTQTTASSGNPSANYCIYTGETGSSKTITCNPGAGGGMTGIQIKDTSPPYISLAADISSDSPATNYVGRTVTFSASITGTAPITNQWKVNTGGGFVSIANATSSTLVLTNAQVSNSGIYELFATNSAGSTNTSALTVTFIAAPTNNDLVNLQFTGFTGGGTAAGAQTGAAAIGNTADLWNTVFSTSGSFTAGTGYTASNAAPVYLSDSLGNGTPIALKYVADYFYNAGAGPFASTSVSNLMSGLIAMQSGRTGVLTFSNLTAGSYNLCIYGQNSGAQTRSSSYTANGLTTVCGPNSSVNVLASPTNYVQLVPTVTSNGVLTITMTGVATGDSQINGLQLQGPLSIPTLALAQNTAINPTNAVYAGYGSVTLSASFGGTAPITNQWEVNTGTGFVPITGATNMTLILNNLQVTNTGSYALFVSNAAGSSNSTPATLTVDAAPTNISFNVQFTGSSFTSGNCPTQVGAAVIGGGSDVWNTVGNPNGDAGAPAGRANGTNLTLFDVGNIGTAIKMDYVGDYDFNGTAFGFSNPFASVASSDANLMGGYLGSVTQSGNPAGDTNSITLHNLIPGIYDLYLYACGRSDGQTRIDVYTANGQSAVCGPNNNNYTLISGVNYVHLTPTVTTNGLLKISYIGTADAGQGLLNGFQVSGPSTSYNIFLTSDTSSDSPSTDYVGRNVTLSATFGGNPAPQLQWEVDYGSGYVAVPNATNSTLTLNNVQTTNSGNYSLFATNIAGGLNSTPLTLTVLTAPSPLSVDVQFVGSARGSSFAATQVGAAVIGGGSDFWNPVSNPNPTGSLPATNTITGTILGLADVNSIGTSLALSYTGNLILNSAAATPFNGSGSPAANLMQACLGVQSTNTGTVTMSGLQPGTYDLYLYSSAGNTLQTEVSQFNANDSVENIAGPNSANNVLTLGTNYVHLTPTVNSNGVLNISFVGNVTGQASLNGLQLSGPGASPLPVVAAFTGSPTNGTPPLAVTFINSSSGSVTNSVWNFGDGHAVTNSSNASVTNTYAVAGTYTVTLTVTGTGGASSATNTAYIVVASGVPPVFRSPVLSGGNLILSGTGGSAGAQYRILSTTNLLTPLSVWVPVWTNVFAPDGSYSYTNSTLNNAAFFILVTP